jgi:hypothetical protein
VNVELEGKGNEAAMAYFREDSKYFSMDFNTDSPQVEIQILDFTNTEE